MKGKSNAVLFAAILLAAGGCGDGASSGDPGTLQVRDSAGVRVVVNRVPDGGIPTFATVSDAPTAVLEGTGPEGASPFSEVAGTVTLPGGLVAVADRRARTVSFHDEDGSVAAVVDLGLPEHGAMTELVRMGWAGGDTVWVVDAQRGQAALVTPAGLYVRDPFPSGVTVAGRFRDGAYLMVPLWSTALLEEDAPEGVRRDGAVWARWWPDRDQVEEVGRFVHDEIMILANQGGVMAAPPPFGRRTSRSVDADGFIVGDQTTFRIQRHSPDGGLVQVTVLEGVDLTLTEALKAAVRPPRSEGDTSLVDRLWAGVPATRPAFSRLLLARDGRLWVAEHVAGEDPPRNWLVFAPDGSALGLVEVPTGFQVLEAGPDYILGVEALLGTPRVVRYGLAAK